MPVVLQGLVVVLQVEVGVPQLAVDGAEDLEVLCSHLDRRLKERHASMIVPGLTEPLAFQGQIQTGRLHPAEKRKETGFQRKTVQEKLNSFNNNHSQGKIQDICLTELLHVLQLPHRRNVPLHLAVKAPVGSPTRGQPLGQV